MGLLGVQLDMLDELFLRLGRERTWAVHPGIGTPDRVDHRSPLRIGDFTATLPPRRARVKPTARAIPKPVVFCWNGDIPGRRDPDRAARRFVAQLERLGHRVTLEAAAA